MLLTALPAIRIFSYAIMTYFKKVVGTKLLRTKQCLPGLPLRIIPYYPPKNLWETLGGRGQFLITAKNLLILPTRKFPLTSFAIKRVIPSPSNSNAHLITLYKINL